MCRKEPNNAWKWPMETTWYEIFPFDKFDWNTSSFDIFSSFFSCLTSVKLCTDSDPWRATTTSTRRRTGTATRPSTPVSKVSTPETFTAGSKMSLLNPSPQCPGLQSPSSTENQVIKKWIFFPGNGNALAINCAEFKEVHLQLNVELSTFKSMDFLDFDLSLWTWDDNWRKNN